MVLTGVAVLAAASVLLVAHISSSRAARPQESRLRAFRNGFRRRPGSGLVDVSLAELFQAAEPDEEVPVTPFAAFDQVRQRAVEQAARAAGLAAALVAREPSTERDQTPEASFPRFSELSFSELSFDEPSFDSLFAEAEPAEPTDDDAALQPGPEPHLDEEDDPAEREPARTT